MPRRDGTGPMGMGAMTGRGMGCCSYDDIGLKKINTSSYGYGLGKRRGNQRFLSYGRQNYSDFNFAKNDNAENEKDFLNQQQELLSEQLTKIQDRLSQIEKNG